METTEKNAITVEAIVKAPIEKTWSYWNAPEHITKWCNASEDWHAPYADNDIKTGGKFKTTMAAKDEALVLILKVFIQMFRKISSLNIPWLMDVKCKLLFPLMGMKQKSLKLLTRNP